MKRSILIELDSPDDANDPSTLTITRQDGSKIYEAVGRKLDLEPVKIVVSSPSLGKIPDPWVGGIVV